ncbi:MAG: OmpA family protein [Puia sp.]
MILNIHHEVFFVCTGFTIDYFFILQKSEQYAERNGDWRCGGATAGAIIGGGGKSSVIGALIGAAVGGGAGYLIGNNMDKQAKAIKQAVPDAQVERVGEGINMTFNSGLLFKINSSSLSDSAKYNLDRIATVFNDYPETIILVEGHTDNTGTVQYNIDLSKMRATTVADYLISKGVPKTDLILNGTGKISQNIRTILMRTGN